MLTELEVPCALLAVTATDWIMLTSEVVLVEEPCDRVNGMVIRNCPPNGCD